MEIKIKRLERVDTPKAVLWVRTSTKKQEVESQIEDLKNMARHDGFKESQIIVLGGAGLSAIKLKDDYLQEFAKLMATLRDNEQVTHLYTWEVSRLARVETKFYELKGFLLDEGVQLALYAGGYRLFRKTDNGKWEIDRGVEIGLSIFVTMAVQEMEIKKARFERARRRNKSEGKRNGGRFRMYGYDVVDGKNIPNPSEKNLLNDIFRMYAQGGYSFEKLAKWLNDHGHVTTAGMKWTSSNVAVLLTKEEYCGADNRYPELVNRELFNKVAEVRKANVKGTGKVSKTSSKRKNLALKILQCKGCGSNYVRQSTAYTCFAHTYPTHAKIQCATAPQVNAEVMDRLLWGVAKVFEEEKLLIQRKFDAHTIKKMIEDVEVVIDNKRKHIQTLQATSKRTNDLYIKGRITEADYDNRVQQIERTINEVNGEISDLNKKVMALTGKDAALQGVKRGGVKMHYSEEEKYDVVHNWLTRATVENIDGNKTQRIEITCGVGGINLGSVSFIFRPFSHKPWSEKVKFSSLLLPEGLKEDIAKELELPLPQEETDNNGVMNITPDKVEEGYSKVLQDSLDEFLEEMGKGRTAAQIEEEWRKEDELNDLVDGQIDEIEDLKSDFEEAAQEGK